MSHHRHVGSRELKNRLGGYLRLVRRGQTLIVTDRGEPVAELRPLSAPPATDAEVFEQMVREGLLSRAQNGPLGPFNPITVRGKPVSETILEDREDRF